MATVTRRLRFQLMFRTSLVVISVVALSALLVSTQIRRDMEEQIRENALQRASAAREIIGQYEAKALSHSRTIALNPAIIESTAARNHDQLLAITKPLMEQGGLEYLVITGPDGTVLVRTHAPDQYNDSIANQANIRKALEGEDSVGIEEGKVVKLSVRAGAPIRDKTGNIIGVVSTGYVLSQQTITETIKRILGADMVITLGSEVVASTLEGKANEEMSSRLAASKLLERLPEQAGRVDGQERLGERHYHVVYLPLIGAAGKAIGTITAALPTDYIHRTIEATNILLGFVAAIMILLVLLTQYFQSRSIVGPILKVAEAAQHLARGDLTHQLHIAARNEIGLMADELARAVENLRGMLQAAGQVAVKVAAISTDLTSSAGEVSKVCQYVSAAVDQLARGASDQATSAQSVNETVQKMSDSIRRISDSADLMVTDSQKASETAQSGSSAVEKAIAQVNAIRGASEKAELVVRQLNEHSREIGQIVEAIAGIADQTNLLALNAAIEAARAGEQGRGFAVVADEVRKLAEQSRESTEQIASLLHEVQTHTGQAFEAIHAGAREVEAGTRVMTDLTSAFQQILRSVETVTAQVQDVSKELKQLADGAEAVAANIQNISALTQESAASAQEVSASSEQQTSAVEEILSSAKTLSGTGERLLEAIGRFQYKKISERCWEIMQCSAEIQQRCPAYQSEEGRCWLISNTWCGGVKQGDADAKRHNCMNCRFFRQVNG